MCALNALRAMLATTANCELTPLAMQEIESTKFQLFHRCDNGYYGEPLKIGSQCVKCACNGGPCDSISGRCITCQ